MMTLFYIIATGFLVRASGWGPENEEVAKIWPKWKLKLAEFLSDYVCAAIFGVLSAIYFMPLVGAACAAAFLLYRIPAFHGWQNWKEMYWRGLWPTALGFALIGGPFYALLSLPFAALYTLIYTGGYKWLPQTVLGYDKHVWIELASGVLFAMFILGVA